ncbi:MAG: phage tail protein [Nitrospira sp.]|jgi:phage tail-like protein|nr:phage tail protein [Nitrospira sp.]
MATRKDPFRNFRFRVEIDGIQQAAFSEVTGIESTVEPIDYRVGNGPTYMTKVPGITKYGPITLKWGVTDSSELHDWHEEIIQGVIKRKSVAITVLGEDGKDSIRWEVQEAWPSKYHGADLNAKGNDVGIETLELANEGIVRKKP